MVRNQTDAINFANKRISETRFGERLLPQVWFLLLEQ